MKFLSLFSFLLLTLFLNNCGNLHEDDKNQFKIEIKNPKKIYTAEDMLELTLVNPKGKHIDSITYTIGNHVKTTIKGNVPARISLIDEKLGKRILQANVFNEGKSSAVSKSITLVANSSPKLYTYRVLESYPHDIEAFTQGLEFHGEVLYESTGKYRASSLRIVDLKTGKVLQEVSLADHYFGEGLTIINDKIYQLTWKEKTGFIYDLASLKRTGTFVYGESKEGWGLCNDGSTIYKSDGTQKIWSLNSETLAEEDYIEIYTNSRMIKSVNELEWVEGRIYANIYEKDAIAIVDPSNGAVEGVIDLKGLKDRVTQHDKLNVLNGIAYKGEENILYITGKNWDKLFKVEIVEK
jgi:glutamine cyclotransferase